MYAIRSYYEFDDDVTLSAGDTDNAFLGNSTLDGLTFAATRAIVFGNSSATDQVTLSTAAVTINATDVAVTFNALLDGAQAFAVNAGTAATSFNGAA